MNRVNKLLLGVIAVLSAATWIGVNAQQGGSGKPNGSTNSIQYKQNASTFGGTGPGSAGQVLTSNGAAMPPTFQAGSSVTPAALTRTSDTNVTLTLGGTPTTALLQATSITAGWTGTLAAARGGTDGATPTADSALVGNGSAWTAKAVGSCSTASSALTYNTSTHAFGCNSLGSPTFSQTSPATSLYFWDDMLAFEKVSAGTPDTQSVGNWGVGASGTSAISLQAGEAGRPGIARIATGTSATDAVGMILGSASGSTLSGDFILHASNTLRIDCAIRVPTLPDGTNTFTSVCGAAQRLPFDTAATNSNWVLGEVIWNGSAVRWQLSSNVNGGSKTDTAASTGPSANTWYQVTLNATTGTVTMLVDGVQVATHSTNIPTGAMAGFFGMQKSAGGTSRSTDMDYMLIQQTLASRLQ